MGTIIGNDALINEFKIKSIKAWESTPDTFPLFHRRYDEREQTVNEVSMKAFIDDSIKLVKAFKGNGRDDMTQWGTSFKRLIYNCGVNIIGLSGESMKVLLNDGFCDVTADFISEARRFDANFRFDDIFQSLRNVWIMNCIQKLMERNIELTPSILAYSMLYPYTDNFIDTNRISDAKKHNTNNKLGERLSGKPVVAETPLEDKLFKLVAVIEDQYARSLYPMVYQSLNGIHNAQVRSMHQDGVAELIREDILDISAEKGGSSVLADGCLVKGHLSDTEAEFIFHFGLLLQLVDDLQDVVADKGCGHKTLFSASRDVEETQSLTNRLINFSLGIMHADRCFKGDAADMIKKLMKKSIVFLIMGAVSCNSNLYDKKYLIALQEYSPIDFKCLKNSYKRIGREYSRLKLRFSIKSLELPLAYALASGSV